MDAKELGEKRIMEFISKESEYGDDDRALFLDARILPGLGLLSLEPESKILFKIVWQIIGKKNKDRPTIYTKRKFGASQCGCWMQLC